MLQFQALGKGSYKILGGEKPVTVFPPSPEGITGLTLMPSPQEISTPGVISWPGEYNEAGMFIRGIGHLEGQQVSYVLQVDGVRCGILSSPLQDWDAQQIESAPDIDVLIIPADDAKLVQKLVDEFDPRILLLVPSGDGDDIGSLGKTLGVKETLSEFKLKGTLPAEGREVMILTK